LSDAFQELFLCLVVTLLLHTYIFRIDTGTGLAQTYVLVCMKVVCDPRSPDEILERNLKAMYV
jgi:hypothetical protein